MTVTGVELSGRRAEPAFGVVILNWNNAPDTIECLDALLSVEDGPSQIVVVDNGSEDGSAELIEAWRAKRPAHSPQAQSGNVHLIRAGRNLGFAGGTNVGIDWILSNTTASHVILLNNDATVSPSFFTDLRDSLRGIITDAVVGPTIYEDPARDRVWYAGAREIQLRALVQHEIVRPESMDSRPTDFVSGCVMVISRGVIEKIGKLAECYYPAYFEDGDFCHRARNAGFPVLYAPAPVAYHKVGSTVRAANIETQLIRAKNRLRVVYVRRNYAGVKKALALAYLAVTKPARFIVDVLSGNPRRGWAVLAGASAGFMTNDVETR